MRDTGAQTPTNVVPVQGALEGQADAVNVAPGPEPGSAQNVATPKAQPARRRGDPVVRWLMFAIFGVIVLWLASLLSAMVFGLITPSSVPRTAAENNLTELSGELQGGKATTQTYASYIDALINAGQLSKAQDALDQALKTVKTDKSYLLAEQSHLLLTRKDYQGTVKIADQAMAEAQKELKAYKAANLKANRQANAGATMPTSYATAAFDKAEALVATKDYAGAIKAYDEYIKQQPTDSDILVMRGLAKTQVGDNKGAAADYRAALKFIPDYQPALDGLKQIGATK